MTNIVKKFKTSFGALRATTVPAKIFGWTAALVLITKLCILTIGGEHATIVSTITFGTCDLGHMLEWYVVLYSAIAVTLLIADYVLVRLER